MFALKSNSPLHHVLSFGLFFCPEDFIALSDNVLDSLTYPGTDGTLFMIPGIYADLLKAFKQFADFQNKHGWIVPSGHWLELTFEHFEEFVSDHCTIVFPIPTPPVPSPLHPTTAMQHRRSVHHLSTSYQLNYYQKLQSHLIASKCTPLCLQEHVFRILVGGASKN